MATKAPMNLLLSLPEDAGVTGEGRPGVVCAASAATRLPSMTRWSQNSNHLPPSQLSTTGTTSKVRMNNMMGPSKMRRFLEAFWRTRFGVQRIPFPTRISHPSHQPYPHPPTAKPAPFLHRPHPPSANAGRRGAAAPASPAGTARASTPRCSCCC